MGAGSVASSGTYTTPTTTPSPAQVSVTATSAADSTASDSAQVTLATAFPSAPADVKGSTRSNGSGKTGSVTYLATYMLPMACSRLHYPPAIAAHEHTDSRPWGY